MEAGHRGWRGTHGEGAVSTTLPLTSPGRSAEPPERSCARRSRPALPGPTRTSWPGRTGTCARRGTPSSEKVQGEFGVQDGTMTTQRRVGCEQHPQHKAPVSEGALQPAHSLKARGVSSLQMPDPKSPPNLRQRAYGKLGQIFFKVFFSSIQNCSEGGTKYSGKHFQLLAGRGHAGYLSLVPRVGNELRYKNKKPNELSTVGTTRFIESELAVSVCSEKRQASTGLRS